MPWKRKTPATKSESKAAPKKSSKVVGSPQQDQIWDAMVNGSENLTVEALAGTGKTFTMVEGLHRVKCGRAGFVAYNKAIAEELKTKVPSGVAAATMHSMGFSAIKRTYGKGVSVDSSKLGRKLAAVISGDEDDYLSGVSRDLANVSEKLVGLAKNTLAGSVFGSDDATPSDDELGQLVEHFDVEFPEKVTEEQTFNVVREVLGLCLEDTDAVDFDDMIWLPVVKGLAPDNYDLLCIDEAQDLNRCQQQLVLNAADRIIIVGDRHQSIYGFRGADVNSIPYMTRLLGERERGQHTLPLTVTRRCPQSHVKLAQRFVPTFQAMPDAAEGYIDTRDVKQVLAEAVPGDLLICRMNAPVCELAFKLLAQKKRVKIQGRDIGQGILAVIKKFKTDDIDELKTRLDAWRDKEESRMRKRKFFNENQLRQLDDKYDCIMAFTNGCDTVREMIDTINMVFADVPTGQENNGFITLSSVHRAKGLEAEKVCILCPEMLPAPWTKKMWEAEQESNLTYVAYTRSKNGLIFVPDWRNKKAVDTEANEK